MVAAAAGMTVETEAGTGSARRALGWTAPAVKGRSLGQAGAEAGLPFPRPGSRPRRARLEGAPLATIAWDRPTPSRRQNDAGTCRLIRGSSRRQLLGWVFFAAAAPAAPAVAAGPVRSSLPRLHV